jgi:cytochrome P450
MIMESRTSILLLLSSLFLCDAFIPQQLPFAATCTRTNSNSKYAIITERHVTSDLDEIDTKRKLENSKFNNNTDNDMNDMDSMSNNKIPGRLRITGRGIPSRKERIQLLDSTTYEADLMKTWDQDPNRQKGFDWEIEKLRRYFAGLRMREDGSWVRQPSFFEFLVNQGRTASVSAANAGAPRPVGTLDVVRMVTLNMLSNVGFGPSLGMAAVPTAVIQKYEGSSLSFIKGALGGDLQTLAGGPLFLLLAKYFQDYGPIFNLAFGPKAFLVISDPVMARHVLQSSPEAYCKGMLAEILEPIMGKGLIPADPVTWKVRRRAIVPGFHKRWLNRMITLFGDRAQILVDDMAPKAAAGQIIDLEERFGCVTLDIIGKAVFNYDFGSVTKGSPIIKAVYRVLRESEHRSSSFIPYWNLPYADQWMGGQVEFRKDMTMLDDILADLINDAVSTRKEASIEELELRENSDDPSLLRFLCDMRGEDLSSKILRDDLMTMLIAGHETTAAMLTWSLFEMSRGDPGLLKEVQSEVRTVLGNKDRPDYDDIVAMKKLRYCLIEALRLYPEPPVLIRRARTEDNLPPGSSSLKQGIKVLRGTDMFISTWNLHRSPDLWENAETFDPTRWDRRFTNAGVEGWKGYDPDKITGLYPNEYAADFAFLPFGGGSRKCVGDQFAMMEATVTMAMVINNYDLTFAIPPEEVGMKTGATIHTENGLQMYARKLNREDAPEKTNGWWGKQHLKRGLDVNGRPYETKEDAAWQTQEQQAKAKAKDEKMP